METNPSITIGKILDALEKEIFSDDFKNEFEKKCRERENAIKEYINICAVILQQHVEKPDLPNRNFKDWKKVKAKECMLNLVNYTEELVNDLDRDKIEAYCRRIVYTGLSFGSQAFYPDIILLTLNSYYGAVVTDIYWIPNITMSELMQISSGTLPISELGKRTPDIIDQVNKLLKSNFNSFQLYKKYLTIIEEAFNCYHKKFYKAFNLLLLTIIEGLTRELGKYLIKQQHLNIDAHSEKYNSLNSFLRNIPWKEDLKISKTKLALLTSNYKRTNYNDPLAELPKPFQTVNISLKTRLSFLCRRFKENRDLVLHGQEIEYDNSYHGYINISALLEVIKTILEYNNFYKKE